MEQRKHPYHHGDLRSALLGAGEAMLERVGAEALSMRELAREVGVSNNAPRRHFASKQALLEALAVSGFERLGAALDRAVADREQGFEKRIVRLARASVRFAASHRVLFQLMFAAKQHPDASPALIDASYKALSAGPATMVYGQGLDEVVPGNPEHLALTVFAAVQGLVSLSANGKFGGVPLDRLAEQVVKQIIMGLRPRT